MFTIAYWVVIILISFTNFTHRSPTTLFPLINSNFIFILNYPLKIIIGSPIPTHTDNGNFNQYFSLSIKGIGDGWAKIA